MLGDYTHLLLTRAEQLVPILLLALVIGEPLARITRFDVLLLRGRTTVATLGRKLDRESRSTATLVYRGIVATALLLVAAITAALLIIRATPATHLATFAALLLWFGHILAAQSGWRLWKLSRNTRAPLELPDHNFLFADSHAALRYSIEARAESFAVGIVGSSFWYLLGGVMPMLTYLITATAAARYGRSRAFGWAARNLFKLLDAPPRLIISALMILAAFFTPGARPFAVFRCSNWRNLLARLLSVSLGGPGPEGTTPWVGSGTARLTHRHLRRALFLLAVTYVLLVLLLATPEIHNLLSKLLITEKPFSPLRP